MRGVPCGSCETSKPTAVNETPDLYGAYPRLSEEQILRLSTRGEHRRTHADEVLYREGATQCDFFVVLEGTVAIVEDFLGPQHVLAVHGPGRFLGEINLLTGESMFVTAV